MTKQSNNYKLIQWNIRSINSNYWNLVRIINEESPGIILLNETWLKQQNKFKIKNYIIERDDRHDGKGGIATLIKQNIIYKRIDIDKGLLTDSLQILVIQINNLIIINIYNPPNKI